MGNNSSQFLLEALEPRLLLSADGLASPPPPKIDDVPASHLAQLTEGAAESARFNEELFAGFPGESHVSVSPDDLLAAEADFSQPFSSDKPQPLDAAPRAARNEEAGADGGADGDSKGGEDTGAEAAGTTAGAPSQLPAVQGPRGISAESTDLVHADDLVETLRSARGPPGTGAHHRISLHSASEELASGQSPTGEGSGGRVIQFKAGPDQTSLFLQFLFSGNDSYAELSDSRSGLVLQEVALGGLGELQIIGNDQVDDLLIVDLSGLEGSEVSASIVISYQGGEGGVDELALGGTYSGSLSYSATGPKSGAVAIDRAAIQFTGLEAVSDSSLPSSAASIATSKPQSNPVAARVFNGSPGNDVIRLRDEPTPGQMIIESGNGSFASLSFLNPTTSLTINGLAGNDEIHIDSLDPAFIAGLSTSGSPELHISGGPDTDSVFVSHHGNLIVTNAAIDGGLLFHPFFDDVPEQVIVSGGTVDASAFTGVAVVIPGTPDWQEEGPGQIRAGAPTLPPSPFAGATEVLAIHPFNERIMYAGTVNGGVWRTVDGGVNWAPLTDQFPSLSISALAIHSTDSDGNPLTATTPVEKLVIYAGTGQRSSNFDAGFAIGILRSRDGGSTWTLLGGTEMAGLNVSSIVAGRIGGSDVVIAGTEGKVVLERATVNMSGSPTLSFVDANPDTITRSTGSWLDDGFAAGQLIQISGTSPNDGRFTVASLTATVLTLETDNLLVPATAVSGLTVRTVLSVKLVKKGGIFRSTNGGDTFAKTVLVDPQSEVRPIDERSIPTGSITDVVLDPGLGAQLYAAVRGGGVFRSTDAGQTWIPQTLSLTLANDGLDNDGNGKTDDLSETSLGAQRILLAVQQNPASSTNAIYAGLIGVTDHLIGVFRSTDQGATWALLGGAPLRPVAQMVSPVIRGGLSFTEDASGPDTITRIKGSWIRDGILVGHRITVKDSASNDGTYTVAAVNDSTITLDPLDLSLTTEPNSLVASVTATPVITFANSDPDTIKRNVGSWVKDGFAVGQLVSIDESTSNNTTFRDRDFRIAAIPDAQTLVLIGSDQLTAEVDIDFVEVRALAPGVASPTTTQPQINRLRQGELHFALAADAAGNLFMSGDTPPNVFRWDNATGTWDAVTHAIPDNPQPHPDSRFMTLDRRGNLWEADDGGVYRLLNPERHAVANLTGNPTLTFQTTTNPHRIERSTGSWISDGFVAGQQIVVSGARVNNGVFTVASVTAQNLTLTANALFFEQPVADVSIVAFPNPTLTGNPTLTFAVGNPATITRPAGGSWITDGFAVGDEILISGSLSNNNVFSITGITATVLTLDTADAITAEPPKDKISVAAPRVWQSFNAGLAATEILSVAYDPISNVILAGTQDNGVIEQPFPANGVDDDGDTIIDEPDERFRWSEVVVAGRPGDGNTTQTRPVDTNGDFQFDEVVRFTGSNNLDSFGQRTFDSHGNLIPGTDNLLLFQSPISRTLGFTADNSSNQLHITSHGLSTGDGPLRVSATGGGQLPVGLTTDQVYFAIRVDKDNVRLAISEQNARAGTAVDLTNDGSGLRVLTMPFIEFSSEDVTFDDTGPNANTIRIPGHGLSTGAGPFALTTSRGGTLPAGVFKILEYFVIRVDDDHIRLAESNRGNAVNGVAVNLFNAGVGSSRLSTRFSRLDPADEEAFRRGFTIIPYVVNAVDPSRMALGLFGLYVSQNVGTTTTPLYNGLDTIHRVFRSTERRPFDALAYGGKKGGVPNPDVLYGARRGEIIVRRANALTGNPGLVFADNGTSPDTITRSAGSWKTDGFAPDQQITIFGSTQNNGRTYKVESVTDNILTLASAETVVAEGAVSDVSIDVFSVEQPPGATTINDLVLDPEDYDVAYAVSDSKVYKRTSPGKWESISQLLGNFKLRSIELVEVNGTKVLLVGGVAGLFRAIDPQSGVVWTELGRFLPNANVRDIDYVDRGPGLFANPNSLDRSDVLVAGTLGRGAWLVTDADAFLAKPTNINIVGAGSGDIIRISRNASNASLLDIFVNSAQPVYSLPFASVNQILINGNGGGDQLTLDSTNGPLNLPLGIHFDGGVGTNQIILQGVKVYDVATTTAAGVTTVKIEDTRGGLTFSHSFQNATLNNQLQQASVLEVIGDGIRRFFRWIAFWLDEEDPTAGAAEELALIGRSLPSILNGASRDVLAPIADPGIAVPNPTGELGEPGESAEEESEAVENGSVFEGGGLERLIESGPGGFSLEEIGASILSLSELRARLDALDTTPNNVTLDQTTDRDGDGKPDVKFVLQIKRTLQGDSEFKVDGEQLGGEIELEGEFSVSLDVVLNLTFGVDSANGLFIDTTAGASNLSLTNLALEGNLEGGGHLGFLDVVLRDATVQVDPALTLKIALQDPSGGNTIRINELTGALLDPAKIGGLANLSITGSSANDLVLSATVEVGAFLPDGEAPFSLGAATITATWPVITDPANVNFTFSAGPGQDLLAFLQFGADEVLNAIDTFEAKLTVMDVGVVGLDGSLYGLTSFLDFLKQRIIAPLRDPVRGSANFSTIQDLVSSWSRGRQEELANAGIHYDSASKELTYTLDFDHHLATSENPVNFNFHSDGNASPLAFDARASVDANIEVTTTLGFDLGKLIGGAGFQDVFFFKDTVVNGDLNIDFNQLDLDLNLGPQQVSVHDADLELGMQVTVSPSGADKDGDGKITLRELASASVGDLLNLSGTTSIDATLPFSGNLSVDALGGLGLISQGNYVVGVHSDDLLGDDPFDISLTLSGSIQLFGQALEGSFTFQRTDLAGARVTAISGNPFTLKLFDGALASAPLVTATGHGLFILTTEGVLGDADVDVSLDVAGLSGLTGAFSVRANTTSSAFVQSITIAGQAIDFDLPAGPYLQIAGDGVSANIAVAGVSQSISGNFVFEQSGDGAARVVKFGASNASATLVAGSVGLAINGGVGGFVLKNGGLAGVLNVASLGLTGVPGATVSAVNVQLQINNTGVDVNNGATPAGPVQITVAGVTVAFEFTGPFFQNFLAVSGGAEIALAGFVNLRGNVAFERAQFDTNGDSTPETVMKLGMSDLNFTLKAGSVEVLSFHHGTGAFVLTDAGFSGVADLDFEVGLVGLSGAISMEVNTRSSPIQATVVTAVVTKTFNLTDTQYFLVRITNAHLQLGSTSIPFPGGMLVRVNTSSGAVEVRDNTAGTVLVSVAPDGTITTGLSFGDFGIPGPFEMVSLLRQLLVWFDSFRDSDVFKVEIPFTDTTLGEALDWGQLFLDKVYSNLVSVELQSGQDISQLISNAGGALTISNAKLRLQVRDESPVEINVNGTFKGIENPADPLDGTTLVGLFNKAIAAVPGLANRLVARVHHDAEPDIDRFVIALQPAEIAKESGLKLVDLQAPIAALGFGPADGTYGDEDGSSAHPITAEQVGVETQRFKTEEFFVALGNLLGIPITYDPKRLVYTYTINQNATYETTVPFNFNGRLGDLADAEVQGLLHVIASVGFNFNLGFDLGAREVPRILTSTLVPVPVNGQISADANFDIFFNDDKTAVSFSGADRLQASATTTNSSIDDLAADLNALFATKTYQGQPVSNWLVAQKAGSGLAISVKDQNLGIINRLSIRSQTNDPFAAEMGFGIDVVDLDNNPATSNDRFFVSTSQSTIKGLFVEDAQLTASLQVNTETNTATFPEANPNGITGSVRFGFIELSTSQGAFGTLDFDGVTPHPIALSVGLKNEKTGSTRYYLPDLFQSLESTFFDQNVSGPNLTGSFLARLRGISINGFNISQLAGDNPEITVWIPDINHLTFNPDAYNGTNSGLFLAYPDLGHLLSFQSFSFSELISALRSVVDNLNQLSAFGFLDTKLPLINVSVNDLVDYAAKFAEIVDHAANRPADSLQSSIDELEHQIEELFDLDPDVLHVTIDTNGITPFSLRLNDGSPSTAARTGINPSGNNNGFTIQASSNGAANNGISIRLVGDNAVTGNAAKAEFDPQNRVLTIRIRGGETTTNAIVTAINAISGHPFVAANSPGENGTGLVRTAALKFSLAFTTAFADQLSLQLDLKSLVKQLAGNSAASGLLAGLSTLVQAKGSGVLDVSVSAALTLDFGIDVTNPLSPDPFLYDTTGITLLAKVLGRDISIETSLGSVLGVFIEGGQVTLDRDGDPNTNPNSPTPDRGAEFSVKLKDSNGDHRVYLSENLFTTDIIDITLTGGLRASLPIFAPIESLPLGGQGDGNNDGHPDNELFIQINNFAALLSGADAVTLITPDLSALTLNVDFCAVLQNAGLLLSGLDGLLGDLEGGLRDMVESSHLPLLGEGFAGAANFISNFRNGLLGAIRRELDNAGGNATTVLENALKKAFWETLGPDGLDLLVDPVTGDSLDPSLGFHQLDVKLDCDTGLIVNLRLRKEVAVVDTSQNPIDLEIGVPGLGLAVEGNVRVSIGFDLEFGFGLNIEDGFFFNSSAGASDPELRLFFEASIPGLAAKGTLALLQLDVSDDPANPSSFVGQFVVDLKDPNNDGRLTFAEITSSGANLGDIFDAALEADVDLNLDLAASFGGNTSFPRVLAEFHLDWRWDLQNGAGDPQVTFTNVALDLGTFISQFLNPILSEIRKVTEPLDPIVEIATARLPVLSDLAGKTITLLDLAQVFGVLEPSTKQFIESVAQVIDIINSLPQGTGTILVPFGSFSLGMASSGRRDQIQVLDQLGSTDFAGALNQATGGPGTSSTYMSQVSGFAGKVNSLKNFRIPIFDHPAELFNLFIGKPVELIEWRMPTFKFEFTYTQKIPIYPPLFAHFGGTIGATINIGFGYDTFGIQKFIASPDKNALDLLDGFHVLDFDANGKEQPELELRGEIFAGASINLLIVEAGVTGGIFATIQFDLNDVNDDGKVRVSEILANAQLDPRCVFDIHGELGLFLEAFLRVNLFFFSLEKTWRFAEITLFSFDITCPQPVLGTVNGSGILNLNFGADAPKRIDIDTNDTAESVVVTHLDGDASSEKVEVQWGSFSQSFDGVTKIVLADAGQGNDLIDVRGILVDVDVNGGVGDDTLFASDGAGSIVRGGDGNDFLTASGAVSATGVQLFGDAGNDTLSAASAAITIHGGPGNDIITGSPQADHLFGDDGADTIAGGDGDDEIDGGAGNDTLDGQSGNDFLTGGAGVDSLRGSRGNDLILGGSEEDELLGGSDNDLLIGGPGNDKVFGHGGVDLLIGDNVGQVANLTVSLANIGGITAALAAIPAGGIKVSALTGASNDFLVGGGNVDVLFGGDGNDFLYGGNLFANGETEVIEEDHNDFFDGGTGDDEIFGDDALGRTGDRNTGIEIRSAIFYDNNKNGLRDADEVGFAGIKVELRKQSDDSLIGTEQTDADGSFAFNGLDPNKYYLLFLNKPTSLTFVFPGDLGSHLAEASENDSDVINGATGRSATFQVDLDETETHVTAGFTGDPQMSIKGVSLVEGDAGQVNSVFTVTLSGPQTFPVTVGYATSPGTATAVDGDYVHTTGTLVFGPGVVTADITVPVLSDLKYEDDEQFTLTLSNPSGGVKPPATPSVIATLINDDPVPQIGITDFNPNPTGYTVDNVPIFDEDTDAIFVISLTNPSYQPVSVTWQTDASLNFQGLPAADAATPSGLPDADFQNAGGVITFEPGETRQTITIQVLDDDTFDTDGDPTTVRLDESEESFFVSLSQPKFAFIADDRGYGVIQDDDAEVSVSIAPANPHDPDGGGPLPALSFETHVAETQTNLAFVNFNVTLAKRSGKAVTVTYSTSPGTAVESVFSGQTSSLPDYEATPQPDVSSQPVEFVFAPGETSKSFTVKVFGDSVIEPNEQFYVNLLNAENAQIAADPKTQSNHVTVVIEGDDTTPPVDQGPYSIRFSDSIYVITEPTIGTTQAAITILRTPGSSNAIALFATNNETASAPQDYGAVFRQLLLFKPDELQKTVLIPIFADNIAEGEETVLLDLRDPTGKPVNAEPNRAHLIIRDATPGLLIEPPTFFSTAAGVNVFGIKEGSGNVSTDRNFTVRLKGGAIAGAGGVQVQYQTVDLTARAGSDYTAETGTIVIPPGANSTTVAIAVFQDKIAESTEKLAVRLFNPQRAALEANDGVAVASLFDDDGVSVTGQVFYDLNENGFKDLNEVGINGVDVTVAWKEDGASKSATVKTATVGGLSGIYQQTVFLGDVSVAVNGATVKSPYSPFVSGSGSYETTTNNETQAVQFLGAEGISPFARVGYNNSVTFDAPVAEEQRHDTGRGGTDDTIYGGPGNDFIDAGAGDDHVVGGHWMTATDFSAPINLGSYDAAVTVTIDPDNPEADPSSPPLHNVYDKGPIFSVDTSALPVGGRISGEIWRDQNNNSVQDTGEPLFIQEVVVNLFDAAGNPVNSVVTSNGAYQFTGLPLKPNGAPSQYLVAFDLPQGFTFVSPNTGSDDSRDSDVLAGNRTDKVQVSNAQPNVTTTDAGVEPSDTIPVSNSGGFEFSEISYNVLQSAGKVRVTIVRADATKQAAIFFRTEDGSAVSPTHYSAISGLVVFDVGETFETVDIPIQNAGLGLFGTLHFGLKLREPSGRPLDDATVYIYGEGEGTLTEDDFLLGGDDFDILIGDSGVIPAPTVISVPSSLNGIVSSGGPGQDTIQGGKGPDFINGQLGNDVLAGNEGQDQVRAGLGNDEVLAELDDDDLNGEQGTDTIVSLRDVVLVELSPIDLVYRGNLSGAGAPLSSFNLNSSFEVARLFGGTRDNVFDLQAWNGAAFISGGSGHDSLRVTNDTSATLTDATLSASQAAEFFAAHGFFEDAAISLVAGVAYQLGSIEDVTLAGGPGNNRFDASGYSRDITLVGRGGNDTLTGGSGANTFLFDADANLGTDVITGGNGIDLLDFSITTAPVHVDLSAVGVAQPVTPGHKLLLTNLLDSVTGGDGADTLIGNSLDNLLFGGPGNDRLEGGPGNETYTFDTDIVAGTETIVENVGGGNDTLDFSSTTGQVITIDLATTAAQTINGNLTLVVQNSTGAQGEIENLTGGALDDALRGNGLNNTLRGGTGRDLIDGRAGNDVLDGGQDNDSLNGGADSDTINETADTDFFLSDSILMRGTGEVDTLAGIEVANLTGGPKTANEFVLTGWSGTGSLDGADDTNPASLPPPFVDSVVLSANANFILTDDSLQITDFSGSRSINLTNIEGATLIGGPSANTLNASAFSGQTTLVGAGGNDILKGGAASDLISAGDGDDTLTGGRGNDTLNGGAGNDSLVESLSGVPVGLLVALSDVLLAIDQIIPAIPPAPSVRESDQLISINTASITGSASNDRFDLTKWTQGGLQINGAGGTADEILVLGRDRTFNPINGSAIESGDDVITLSDTQLARNGLANIAMASIEIADIRGLGGNDVIDASAFAGIARLTGGSDSDTLTGGRGNDALSGDDPNDPKVRAGDDRFIFKPNAVADDDQVDGGAGQDILDFSGFTAGIILNLGTVATLQTVVAAELRLNLKAQDIEAAIGGSGNDQMTGNALVNTFTGGLGSDTITGIGTDDRLIETADANQILTNASLKIGPDTDTLANITVAELTGGAGNNTIDATGFSGRTVLKGLGGTDNLIGGSGSDRLVGGGGNDSLNGGNGADTYVFDADELLGSDTLTDSGTAGLDVVDFSETTTVDLNVSLAPGTTTIHATNLTLTINAGTEIEGAIGGDQNDTLTGNNADNILTGGLGSDTIDGLGGVNTVVETRDTDMTLSDSALTIGAENNSLTHIQRAVLIGGSGSNILNASNFTLGRVDLLGLDGNDMLLGGRGGDNLEGGGNDFLFGGAGNDTIKGGDGADTLNGGGFDPATQPTATDNDILEGGRGNDTYVFDQSQKLGADIVTELTGEGFLDLLNGAGLSGVKIDLFLVSAQFISANLTLTLTNPGQIEDAF